MPPPASDPSLLLLDPVRLINILLAGPALAVVVGGAIWLPASPVQRRAPERGGAVSVVAADRAQKPSG